MIIFGTVADSVVWDALSFSLGSISSSDWLRSSSDADEDEMDEEAEGAVVFSDGISPL